MTRSWWYQSAPWLCAFGGLLAGVTYQLEINSGISVVLDLIGIGSLFAAFPPLGYLVLTAMGFAFGWTFRRANRSASEK